MYRFTERRLSDAKPILEKHRQLLATTGEFRAAALEMQLRKLWAVGNRELKDIMIDMLRHARFRLVASYYMEHANCPGPVSEFKQPLAQEYGIPYYHADDREEQRAAYWHRELAALAASGNTSDPSTLTGSSR